MPRSTHAYVLIRMHAYIHVSDQDMCFDAIYVNLALEPTAALAALDVALELDGE